MANALYTDFKVSALSDTDGAHRTTDLAADEIRVGLVNLGTDYTYGAAHQDWADIGAYGEDACYNGIATEILTAGNITVTAGVFDCTDDITFADVSIDGAKDVDAIVHYAATGTNLNDDPLICYHDGFSVTPNDGKIIVQYHSSGIFAL